MRPFDNKPEGASFFAVQDHGDVTVLRLGIHVPEHMTDLRETDRLWDFLAGRHGQAKKVLLITSEPETLAPASLDEFWTHVHKDEAKGRLPESQIAADVAIAREENAFRHFVELLRNSESFVISAVQGQCDFSFLGGILASDYRIASEDTAFINRLFRSETTVGVLPWFLSRFLGHAEAADILLEGRSLTATEAYDLKLVNKLVPSDCFEQMVFDVAERFASIPTHALRSLKRSLVASVEGLAAYLDRIGTGFQYRARLPQNDPW